MGKIEVEDLTPEGMSEKQRKIDILTLANGLVQTAGRGAPMLGLRLQDALLALLIASEVLGIVGEEAGKVEDLVSLKETAKEYAQERYKHLKEAGIVDIIRSIGDTKER